MHCRLNMAASSCVRFLCARTTYSGISRAYFTDLHRTTVKPVFSGHQIRPTSNGQRHISCTSHLLLGPQTQDCTYFKWDEGWRSAKDKTSDERFQDESQFNYAESKIRKALLAVGGILFGGIVFMSPNLFAEEDHTEESLDCIKISTDDDGKKIPLERAVKIGRELVQRIKDECGTPGLVVAVTVDGKPVWQEGFGYADVENRVPCAPETVLRIASISKPITMAAVAKLWEQGLLDLDKPVQYYVPEFPEKTWNGEKVTITTRQLLCHLGGIRHYEVDYIKDLQAKDKKSQDATDKTDDKPVKDEMKLEEYYIKDYFPTVSDGLKLFKDDPLVKKPGSEFYYTTHGWTLISAVVEKAAKTPFKEYLASMLKNMGLNNTFMEENQQLIYNRGRHYVRNAKNKLENAPYTDLSYKWAGGGLVSNVCDLVKFGNIMLGSYQAPGCHGNDPSSSAIPGFLRPETVKEMWTRVDKTEVKWGGFKDGGYGLGWAVWDSEKKCKFCRDRQCFVSHTGNAIGASSVLLILPSQTISEDEETPKGVVVSIIVNMVSVGLNKTAYDIAKVFDNVELGSSTL